MKKELLFGALFLVFCVISVLGQTPQPPLWTTVNGSSVRNIPLNSVKSEAFKLINQYNYFGIDASGRSVYKTGVSNLLRSWLDNNQNFAFANQDRTNLFGINIDLAQVIFVIGDIVYSLHFHPNYSEFAPYSTKTENNRLYLDQEIDKYIYQIRNGR